MDKVLNNNWQSVGDWAGGKVRSGAKAGIWLSLLFGVAFTGISLPAVLEINSELDQGNIAALLVLLFPLVGLVALGIFIRSLLAWRKFGATELVLDPVPGCIGGDFGAYMDVKIPWHRDMKMNITLNCQRLVTTGSGKSRSTKTEVIWQREGIATLSPGYGGTHCEFRFAIPDDLPESEPKSRNCCQWVLQLDCELPGIDFKRNYLVPVFRCTTPQLSNLRVTYARDSAPLEKAPQSIVHILQQANGLLFHYPWYRHWWLALLLIVFGSIFAAMGYFVAMHTNEMIMPIIMGVFACVTILSGLYKIANTLTTTVTADGILTIRNVLGVRFQRKVKKENIVKLDRVIKGQMQTGSSHKVYYAIVAHTRDGRKVTIADALEGSRLADFVDRKIRKALRWESGREETSIKLDIP